MSKYKFIIVSNRLPVSVSKVDGELIFTPSSGGLAQAMASLDVAGDTKLWIGWPGISSDDLTASEKSIITRKLRTYGCLPVFLTAEQVKLFYEGYANDTIWPLFHYFQSFAQYDDAYWAAYKQVTRLFYRAVVEHAAPRATLWIHDYHLMLLPRLARKALPKSSICFFMHIPFPSFEIFRLLPNRKAILEGLLGADLVGFHIYDYAQYFINSVRRTLGYESRHGTILLDDRFVTVDAFPIGIDYQKFTDTLHDTQVAKELDILDEHYDGQKIILSVDRLDYTKGIPSRLRAFEEFLNQHPQYHKKVSLIVIAVPSRVEVQAYKDLRETIEQMVSRINGTYATVDWTPISYQFQHIPFAQLVALYKKASVALVTPLRDGMNLVAKEYIACKQEGAGVLILSELAGAADELQEAIRINPNDLDGVVEAIKQALTMTKREQMRRMRAMQRRISQYTLQRWAQDMMEQLAFSKNEQVANNGKLITSGIKQEIVSAFQQAKRRALFLDYDGTLMNFVGTPDPAKAAPPKSLLNLLRELAQKPGTRLYIISGRTRQALEQWFGDMPITLIAEHGSWLRDRGKWLQENLSFQKCKDEIIPILKHYVDRTPGARFEEKDSALVWHYRSVPPELAYARNTSLRHELNSMLADTEIGVFNGNKIIEIKPRAIRKSNIMIKLLHSSPADFVLCAGDDYTDEDMLKALPSTAYTIKVGLQETHARYQIPSVGKLREVLQGLL